MDLTDPRRIRIARETAGLRKKDLAGRIGVSPASITQYEAGRTVPPSGTLARIALACGFAAEFFGAQVPACPGTSSRPFFRSLRSTRQWERDEAEARATLVWQVTHSIETRVNLPDVELPDLHLAETAPLAAAAGRANELRKQWDLPLGPMGNIIRLIEARGAVVSRIHSRSERVDAFSQWLDGRPFIVLWRNKGDTARSRFDGAHELGHLVMHPDPDPGNKLLEQQAHAFASELLMPAERILDELPRRPPRKRDLPDLIRTKERWGVSISALYYRARSIGVISPEAHRRSMIRLSELGLRSREPGELGEPEQPFLLRSALELLDASASWGISELATELRLPSSLIREICAVDSDQAENDGPLPLSRIGTRAERSQEATR